MTKKSQKDVPANCLRVTRVRERGDYLSFVEALQSRLLACDCAVSIVRLEEAGVEESRECCQTARDSYLLGSRDDCNRKSGSKGNDDEECKKN